MPLNIETKPRFTINKEKKKQQTNKKKTKNNWSIFHNIPQLNTKKTSFFQNISINHHHNVALVAQVSLTLSRHSSLSFIAPGRSSGQHPVSSHSCWMYVRAGRPAFARSCVGVHKSTSLMSSSLLLQQCPAYLVRLTWIVKNQNFTPKISSLSQKKLKQLSVTKLFLKSQNAIYF